MSEKTAPSKIYVAVVMMGSTSGPMFASLTFEAARDQCLAWLKSTYPTETFIEKPPGYFSTPDSLPGNEWAGRVVELPIT